MGLIRRLYPSDSDPVAEHLLRLSPADRRLRFCSALSDGAIRAHVARLDWVQAAVFGFVEDGCIRGMAELLPDRGVPSRSAEAAFSVEASWRGRGIGGTLMRRVLSVAGAYRIGLVQLSTEIGNLPMRRIAARYGAVFVVDQGEIFATIAVPDAHPAGMLLRSWVDGTDALLASADQLRRWAWLPQPDVLASRC